MLVQDVEMIETLNPKPLTLTVPVDLSGIRSERKWSRSLLSGVMQPSAGTITSIESTECRIGSFGLTTVSRKRE